MKIEELNISGIGGIRELNLKFGKGFNVICGPNGIGKTTILKVIVDAFGRQAFGLGEQSAAIKRNSRYDIGCYTISYQTLDRNRASQRLEVSSFNPLEIEPGITRVDYELAPYVMYFRDERSIRYEFMNGIPRDGEREASSVASSLYGGISSNDLKGWLENRYLFSDKAWSISSTQKANFKLAISAFSKMDPSVSFKTVDSSSLDIMLATTNGDIFFEYLSSGYKSCVYLIMGLIKEIEYRFGGQGMRAADFDGVVLIDEIDLHLHPTWQARLVKSLKSLFPQAQFIVTTHSPSVLQSLQKEEIIPLSMNDEGNVFVKELHLTEYGLQGWSIEEILHHVMEMPETTSELFEKTKQEYDNALDNADVNEIRRTYGILKAMLHPNSVTRKLIDIQVAGLVEEDD